MEKIMEEKVSGDKIGKIMANITFKKVIIDMFKGYPQYEYFGILEYHFRGEKIVEILKKDGLLEISSEKEEEQIKYRLSSKGISLAISMINLEHSEKMLEYTKVIRTLTWIMVGVSILTFLLIIFGKPLV